MGAKMLKEIRQLRKRWLGKKVMCVQFDDKCTRMQKSPSIIYRCDRIRLSVTLVAGGITIEPFVADWHFVDDRGFGWYATHEWEFSEMVGVSNLLAKV